MHPTMCDVATRFCSIVEISWRDEHRSKNQPERPQSERDRGLQRQKLRQRYRPKVEAWYDVDRHASDRNPFPGLVNMTVHVPRARPALFVYSVMDGVILPDRVEAFMATYPKPPSALKFATVPHIGGMSCRPDEYAQAVDDFLHEHRAVE